MHTYHSRKQIIMYLPDSGLLIKCAYILVEIKMNQIEINQKPTRSSYLM